MSKRINVNPGIYKVAGRERQGEDIVQSLERRTFAQQQAETDRWRERQQAPPWETTPANPEAAADEPETPAPASARRRKPTPRAKALNERRKMANSKGRKRPKAAARKPKTSRASAPRAASKSRSRRTAASRKGRK